MITSTKGQIDVDLLSWLRYNIFTIGIICMNLRIVKYIKYSYAMHVSYDQYNLYLKYQSEVVLLEDI